MLYNYCFVYCVAVPASMSRCNFMVESNFPLTILSCKKKRERKRKVCVYEINIQYIYSEKKESRWKQRGLTHARVVGRACPQKMGTINLCRALAIATPLQPKRTLPHAWITLSCQLVLGRQDASYLKGKGQPFPLGQALLILVSEGVGAGMTVRPHPFDEEKSTVIEEEEERDSVDIESLFPDKEEGDVPSHRANSLGLWWKGLLEPLVSTPQQRVTRVLQFSSKYHTLIYLSPELECQLESSA